ncbi:hypothetical protein ABT246_32960, partial [Streptomyces sp. NPDC001553]|uniref:hypothetical protein n=1 Tax=Streptomyces sp. NPDC001553 TaxID=3154385 RepID=UPI003329BE57
MVAGPVRVSRLRRTDASTALWNGGNDGATRRLNSDNRQDVFFSVMRRAYPSQGFRRPGGVEWGSTAGLPVRGPVPGHVRRIEVGHGPRGQGLLPG